jgi:hypothetical protein
MTPLLSGDCIERADVLMRGSKPEQLLSDRGDDRVVVWLLDHSPQATSNPGRSVTGRRVRARVAK